MNVIMMNISDDYWSINLIQLELVIEFTLNLKKVLKLFCQKVLFVR